MDSRTPRCTEERAYAHHWDVASQTGKYVWGRCRHCKKRRMFRNSWPDGADWAKERENRLKEEKKARRKEKRLRQV